MCCRTEGNEPKHCQCGLKKEGHGDEEGDSCKACAKGCGSLAIDAKGNIDQRECMLCLDCMVLYYDDHACPPLAQERKRRDKAGQPLTAINGKGYFIPIKPVPMDKKPQGAQA